MPSSEDLSDEQRRRQEKGQTFERLAAEYFERHGFEILERNWRASHREIDLIVRKENLIVFVEVKSSASTKFGHPAARIDERKMANLTRAAQQYLIDYHVERCDLRFDVVTFVDGRIEHFPDAFPANEES
ncbi:MAG TPA: YraN family protein [Candidatus Deferrimicrobium sp.]|nr:YraN family protein [Candidatus Deferrimicrobium sp.]